MRFEEIGNHASSRRNAPCAPRLQRFRGIADIEQPTTFVEFVANDPGCVKTQTRSTAIEETFVKIVDC
jgi:hypothetical protein